MAVLCTVGSVTDNDLTADCGVLDMMQDIGATVLTDKGLGIKDLCHGKGLCHNCPPMNFDMATLQIYNENYIGCIGIGQF